MRSDGVEQSEVPTVDLLQGAPKFVIHAGDVQSL